MRLLIQMLALLAVIWCCGGAEPFPRVREAQGSDGYGKIDPRNVEMVVSSRPVKSSALAVEMLNGHLRNLPETAGGKKLRIILGKAGDAIFTGSPLETLKLERPQEYVLKFGENGGEMTVYAAGADNRGVFYAAATLLQLLTPNGVCVRDIRDYPEWPLRFLGGYSPVETAQMEELARAKIDGYGIQHRYDWRKFAPGERPIYGKKHTYGEWFKQIREFRERNGDLVDFMMMINVCCGERLDASKEADVELLIEQCLFAAQYVQEIMIQFDDYTPSENGRFVFVSEGEKAKFKNPGQAHGYIVRRVCEAVRKAHPDVTVSVCPAPYSLNGHDAKSASNREYLDSLSRELPEDAAIVWTGPAVESAKISAEDRREYRDLVNGHRLYVWDNTSSMKPTPMEWWRTSFFPEMSGLDGRIYVNGHGFSFFWSRLFMLNANDYLWNPQEYDARKSYAAAFRQLTGRDMPEFVARTQDDLGNMQNLWDRAERGKIAGRILAREEEFRRNNLDFSRIGRTVKPVFDECSAEVKTGTVPKLPSAPKLDASGGDPAWNGAAVYRFGPPKYGSTVKLGYTPESLFVQFRGSYGKAEEEPTRLERDSSLDDGGDVFYLCLQPPLQNRRAGWIAVDRSGNLSDRMEWQPPANFNPQVRKKIRVFPEYWILEMEIPFAELAGKILYRPPQSGGKWNLNFARRNNLDGDASCWSPAPEQELTDKRYFGTVTFR